MSRLRLALYVGFRMLVAACLAAPISLYAQKPVPEQERDRPHAEIPYKDGTIVLVADDTLDKKGTHWEAKGHVRITYQDMVMTCEGAEYDEVTHKGTTSGPTRFTQNKAWLTCSHAEFNFSDQTAKFFDASGYTDQEFLVQGRTVLKTGRTTYSLEGGTLTSCEEKHPKWVFSVGAAGIQLNKTARLHRVLFKLKGVPIFYFPYLIVPMEEKKRSSGFLPFHVGNSSSKGRQFTQGYYQTLGESAEATLYGEYFSKRGFGVGGLFWGRPNAQTDIKVSAFGVDDRQGQGGAQLVVDATSQFENGFRAAAKVNITTNFSFRQVFSEGFRSATVPEEQAQVFATRNFDSFATNFSFERTEVFFPDRSLVLRKLPSIEFLSFGKSLGSLPLVLYFRTAADGVARTDSTIQTPSIVQRLDFFPQVALRLPSVAGFSLIPTVGIRETYYGARLTDGATPIVVPDPLRREYSEIDVDLRTPGLEKEFHSGVFGEFTHLVEPVIRYRRIHGISDNAEIIRFDDQDAIADTNEVEYGIVNRIMRKKEVKPGVSQAIEFLAFGVMQKYYFDPSFGGAFIPGETNQFYPLNTLTGFSATSIQRMLTPISMNLRITPVPGIGYEIRTDYDPKLGRLRDASLWAVWRHDKLQIAGTYVKANALESSDLSAHNVQGQIAYKTPEQNGLSGGVTMSYDFQTNKLLGSTARLNYQWNCCGISLEYQQFSLGLRRESHFAFSFNLKGLGHFGNLRRPENLF